MAVDIRRLGICSVLFSLLACGTCLADPMPVCSTGKRVTCVVDGDTFWLRGEKIRLLDVDAPEKSQPRCRYEAELAGKATRRLQELLSSGEVTLQRNGLDRYGRTLATVTAGGRDVGAELVSESLAKPWPGHKVEWCND